MVYIHMIKQIRLQNFESHKDTVINFDLTTNAIVGESEHGKSAVLRAIYWVAFNKPAGDNFRSDWGGDTEVTISIPLLQITRVKNEKENYYVVYHEEECIRQKFSGFGQTVPEEVTKLLGLYALNFQTQFDPHYLLPPVSPGEVARKLNEIVDLTIIDTTQANVNSQLRNTKKQAATAEQKVAELQSDKKKLHWIKEANVDLKEIEKLNGRAIGLRNKEQKITQALYDMVEVENGTQGLSYINKAESEWTELSRLLQSHTSSIKTGKQISDLLETLSTLDKKIIKATDQLESKKQELKKRFPAQCPLCGAITKRGKQ